MQNAEPVVATAEERFCPNCHYSLHALHSDRCPECGDIIADIIAGKSRIPWVHRRNIGAYRAFWRTVWQSSFSVNAICADSGGPSAYADASRFRWLVVAHAAPPIAIGAALTAQANAPGWDWQLALCTGLGLSLFIALLTGVQTYFFHPRWMPVPAQNRTLALSYYLCGIFAWTPIPILIIWAVFALPARQTDLVFGMQICAVFLPIILVAGWYFASIRAAWKLTHRAARAWAVAMLLPLIAFLLFLGSAAVIPLVSLYIRLVIAAFAP